MFDWLVLGMVILFDRFDMPDDILEVVFSTRQQVIAATLLVEEFKDKDGELGKTEMSMFANLLHDGVEATVPHPEKDDEMRVEEVSYNKRQFYDRILTPMKTMGMVEYDNYNKKYELSHRFNKVMMKIGLMWLKEIRKPSNDLILKDDE
jgi:hypothetical protein